MLAKKLNSKEIVVHVHIPDKSGAPRVKIAAEVFNAKCTVLAIPQLALTKYTKIKFQYTITVFTDVH